MTGAGRLSEDLRAALAQLAAADVTGVLDEARQGARARARELLEGALVEELMRAAAGTHANPVAEPSPDGHAWWTYCVLPARDAARVPRGLEGIVPAAPVEVVVEGELAALTSAVPLAQFDDERLREHLEDLAWVERTARAHEMVLDRALGVAAIVPLRLCTLYRDQDGVRRLLRESAAALADGLAAVEGCVEMGVKLFAEPGAAGPEVSEPLTGEFNEGTAGGDRPGASYLARRQDERTRAERAHELRARCAEDVHDRLSELARAAVSNPPQRREAHGRAADMLLNAAYLVEHDRLDDLHDAVAELRGALEPAGFVLDLTGPWPAYNFVAGTAGIVQ